jgi:3-oxoacyl-[acyl-carrier-protein] synthase I
MRLFIQDYGVTCSLGSGKAAVAEALFAGRDDCLVSRNDILPDRTVVVGAVTGSLPGVPDAVSDLDCRNNRLMLTALREIRDAVAGAVDRYGAGRVAVVCGTSTSGIAEGEAALVAYRRDGHWPNSFHYHRQETGNIGLFVARTLGLQGPAYTIATACSSSGKIFASARRLIAAGLADAVVAGGTDTLCGMTLAGFGALEALSPTRCNPFSVNRDGISIGEGAAAFLLTREPGPIEVLGVGETSDAHHPSAPDPEGRGAIAAIEIALRESGLNPADIGYINLHGTATPLNDAMESRVIAGLFGNATPCGSTKAMTGHMLGATGGVEAAFLCLSLADGRLPPHVWDGHADPTLPPLNFAVPGQTSVRRAMLSNSFGFGGSNVALVLGRPR